MPRPTPAQFVYGSVTVVLSTLAMLLLSGASSGPSVVVIVVAGLALGVLVAVTLAMPWAVRGQGEDDVPAAAHRVRGAGQQPRRGAERILSQQSLRR
jgi:Na+/melibiose symporter-like transporter